MLTPDRAPPEGYYQNNCRTLFGFVLRHYGDLLADSALTQLHRFTELDDDAQRLFARLLTRKGPLLRVDSLNYTEITDLGQALRTLETQGFIDLNPLAPADQLLAQLKKSELVEFARGSVRSSQSKSEMVHSLLSGRSEAQIWRQLRQCLRWLKVADTSLWWLVRLLYFGDAVQDWSAFVIRDLGMVRYEPVAMDRRRFQSREALQLDLRYRRYSSLSRRIDEFPGLAKDLVKHMLRDEEQALARSDRFVRARRDRTLVRIGRWHERLQQPRLACAAYASVQLHPARERLVRVLHKQGHSKQAAVWLQQIRQQPFSDEEAQFAERFGKRGGGHQPPVTEAAIDAVRVDVELQGLEILLAQTVEQGADSDQVWGAHVENSLIRTLTGLLYWEAIFADVPGAFTNPFQSRPNDLYQEDFVAPRADVISRIERDTACDEALQRHLLDTCEYKAGVANSLVSWRLLEHIPLADFLSAMPASDIRKVCAFMIRNLSERKSGLPDLFLSYGANRYEFVEVKGPNDQLQPGQRVWLKHFATMGIPARVLKLKVNT